LHGRTPIVITIAVERSSATQALGPAPEASLPAYRAVDPGGPVKTDPTRASSVPPAGTTGETLSNASEEPSFGTLFECTAAWASQGKVGGLKLPSVPTFPPHSYVIDSPGLPAGKNVNEGGGGRGKDRDPRLLFRDRS
jgi:hypothetical protein